MSNIQTARNSVICLFQKLHYEAVVFHIEIQYFVLSFVPKLKRSQKLLHVVSFTFSIVCVIASISFIIDESGTATNSIRRCLILSNCVTSSQLVVEGNNTTNFSILQNLCVDFTDLLFKIKKHKKDHRAFSQKTLSSTTQQIKQPSKS